MLNKTAMVVCALAAVAGAAAAERVECRVTADNWVEAPPYGSDTQPEAD